MLIRGDARSLPLKDGRIQPGQRLSPKTEFKPGQHWRPRRPWWDRVWLEMEYVQRKRSAADIADEHGVTDGAIHFWLHKHGIPRRDISAARAVKYWGAVGAANPMYGKRGDRNPRWKGGRTPARQALYASAEWRAVERRVKRRDPVCRRCGSSDGLEIHHIEPFRDAPFLALELGNLIRLCGVCHRKIGRRERWWRKRLYALIGEKAGRVVAC
jgi:hypothetical protein